MTELADAQDRQRGRSPAHSFIVQAPAGSGKTGLLTHRFLSLLASVAEPEEILAITFTRKAAAEMRIRVLDDLRAAVADLPVTDDYERERRQAAQAVLAQDRRNTWQLLDYPSRLRIQTIDSLCANLTRQMPWLSGFGAQPGVTEDTQPLYEEAARATLALLDDEEAGCGEAIECLLRHLDNDLPLLQRLLADMLPKREQWLRHLVGLSPAELLDTAESAVSRLQAEVLASVVAAMPADWARRLPPLLAVAASNRLDEPQFAALQSYFECHGQGLPPADAALMACWQAIVEQLLARNNDWRKTVNRSSGFPAGGESAAARKAMIELLQQAGGLELLRSRLQLLRLLPAQPLDAERGEVLQALLVLLPLAAAQLQLVFKAQGQVDFAEYAMRAVHALGEAENPSDLALLLDYQIQHLLIDEFQDTSVSQFDLLRALTAGWTPGDGRTLFAVGDPMQSIYRFREAQVALYLKAWAGGVGHLPLETLRLSTNFRSSSALVDWFNRHFPALFPAQVDRQTGAVVYASATANKPVRDGDGVAVHPLADNRAETESSRVLDLIAAARGEDPQAEIAILVRTRAHAAAILADLRRARLRPTAIELEALAGRAVVTDLLALTRALLHPADRIAWLAVLRAPWCGLDSRAMSRLIEPAGDRLIHTLIADVEAWQHLDAADRQRLQRLRPPVLAALSNRARRRLRPWVEHLWWQLGGPACYTDADALADAEAYLQLLQRLDEGAEPLGIEQLQRHLARLYAAPAADADPGLQVMTMHKAKGLEFDTVILPGLGRGPRPDDSRLLAWNERTDGDEESDLLLAPIARRGEDRPPLNQYLAEIEKQQSANETIRLLYVACTRAKRQLHLLGFAPENASGQRKPRAGSLLAILWPAVAEQFDGVTAEVPAAGEAAPDDRPRPLTRLQADWTLPPPPPTLAEGDAVAMMDADESAIPYEWAGPAIRRIGTVVHRLLQQIAEDGAAAWSQARIEQAAPIIERLLAWQHLAEDQREAAVKRVQQALQQTLDDPTGRWILSHDHQQAVCEAHFSGRIDSQLVNVVIDRSFIDAEGTRWIIDYKTSTHAGSDIEAFLRQEQARYREQLGTYAHLMRSLEPGRDCRLMLYFPLLGRQIQWSSD